ncbi:MAG: hypothetical protein J5590_09685 [Clostridia bacterium]|nr:hypothetical protein [Clostridia bacterium]
MDTVKIDLSVKKGKINPMHSVNNGPVLSRNLGNGEWFQKAHIPYARLHDSALCPIYGGCHTVDILNIFPDFDADPEDPKSYDFAMTDKYLADIISVGTEPFYRLGASIEHGIKKYQIYPPKDFKKWARICEGIIRHYTEGWADGFKYKIEYWEIWNEPDTGYKQGNSPTWRGTMDEFFEFFKVALIYLKDKFPHLKIGGPALCSVTDSRDILEDMMTYLTKGGRAPLDFFSWHLYGNTPNEFERKIKIVDEVLQKYGYSDAESILNEWNYVKDWEKIGESYKTMTSLKGAAFVAGAMCESQRCGLDHLMYYDARPCVFNGMFHWQTREPLKGYYPFLMFNKLYELGTEAEYSSDSDKIFACAAVKDNKAAVMLTYFDDENGAEAKEVKLDIAGFDGGKKLTYYLLDNDNDCEIVKEEIYGGNEIMPHIKMNNYDVVLIEIEKI